jgi:hypothetical protein
MSNEVTTTSNAVPAHLQSQTSGFIEDDSSLMSPPRIKLIQKTSKEFDDGLAKAGEFYNTANGVASSEILVTPIKGHVEYTKFDDEGKVEFSSSSEAEAKQALGEEYWKARRINFLMLPYGETIPAIYTFSGTGYKTGQKLYQLCKTANPGCMFSKAYRIKSNEHSGAGGKYYAPSISVAKDVEGYADSQGWLSEDAFNLTKEIAEQV